MSEVSLVDARDCGRYSATENLGMAGIAAWLRECGISTALRVLDTRVDPRQVPDASWEGARAVGIALFHDNVSYVYELSRRIKQAHPEICVFVGSRFASEMALDVLHDCPTIDAVVLGEGEAPVEALLAMLRRDGTPTSAEGILARNGNPGPPAVCRTFLRQTARDFAFSSRRPAAIARLGGKRGCSRACGFCLVGSPRQRRLRAPRLRSPEDMVDEARTLREQYGVRAFMIHDCPFDEVGPDGPSRVSRLCELLRANAEPMAFECMLDGEHLSDAIAHLAPAMREAGFSQVMMLLGSGNDADRLQLGKRGPLGARTACIDAFAEHDIEVMLEFFMLQPWSTPTTLAQNLRFLRDRSTYRLADYTRRVSLYRGTSLWERAAAEDLLDDRTRYDCPHAYRFVHPEVQRAADAFRAIESTALSRMDGEFQDVAYVVNSLRVLFPREMASLCEELLEAKEQARRALESAFEPMAAGERPDAVPSATDLERALAPVYGRAKAFQMGLLRIPAARAYLMRAVPMAERRERS